MAIPFMLFRILVCMLEPKPSIAISIRIPQNTPNAVRNVRRRFERSVAQISFHLSQSIMAEPISLSATDHAGCGSG